jgi:hypothetical protein
LKQLMLLMQSRQLIHSKSSRCSRNTLYAFEAIDAVDTL